MFETSVVQARAQASARRPLLFSFSIAAHAAAVIGVVAASVATVSLPTHSPRQATIPFFSVMPPMQGDGEQQKQKTPAAAQPQTVKRAPVPAAVVAPTVVPEHATPVAAQTSTADLGPIGNATGPTTDGSGGPGVPWGSKEGVGDDGPPVSGPVPKIYRVGGDVKQPVAIRRVTPPYPPVAQRMRLNGFVILECIIDQTGRVRDAHVVSSSFGAFEQPALDAVQQWQFAPGTLNGVPVDVEFELKVTFQIH